MIKRKFLLSILATAFILSACGINGETEEDGVNDLNKESKTEVVADSADSTFALRLEYESKIADEFVELIKLWGEVDNGNWKLNQLGYQQSVQELSKRLLTHIDYYRENITIPKDEEEAYRFYFEYIDEVEQAMMKLDKASYSNIPTLFNEVKDHFLSASNYHDNYTASANNNNVNTDASNQMDIMTEAELLEITGSDWAYYTAEEKFNAVSNYMYIMSEKENWIFGFSETDYIGLIDDFYAEGKRDIQFTSAFALIKTLEESQ